MKLSSSPSLIRMIATHAFDSTVDQKELLRATDIDPGTLENPDTRISGDRLYRLWKKAESLSNDPHFGLHMGESMKGNPGGNLLFALMMNSPTVHDALDKFCRYHCIMNDAIQPVLDIEADEAGLSWQMNSSWTDPSRHFSELMLSIFQSILNHLAGRMLKPIAVCFRHAQPEDIHVHQKIFPSAILFNQKKDELLFDKTLLNDKIFLSDQRLLEAIEHHASNLATRLGSQHSWSSRVLLSIEKYMQGNKPVIAMVANDLAVSVRFLQNKLHEEETSFQRLLDKARKEKAIFYLKNSDMPLIDIAFILGFSEQSTFNHTFKRLTGMTPTQYRQVK